MAWLRPTGTAGWFHHRQPEDTLRWKSRGGRPAGSRLANATTALIVRAYALYGEETDRVGRLRDPLARVIRAGCRDPLVAEIWALHQSAGGRPADLEAAIASCDQILESRPEGRAEAAWASLTLLRSQLHGRLRRMSGQRQKITADGKVELIRLHHPGLNAKRIRPMRFVRG